MTLLNVNKLIKHNSACISLEKWQRNNTKSLTHIMMQAFASSQGHQLPELLKEVKAEDLPECLPSGCLTLPGGRSHRQIEQKEKEKLMHAEKPRLFQFSSADQLVLKRV